MESRPLGKTELQVSRLGVGTWALGGEMWRDGSVEDAEKTLFEAVERGVTLVDTALVYSEGESERRVGKVVRELRARDEVVVASKVPPLNRQWPAAEGSRLVEIFPADYVQSCVEDSLRNLKLDVVPLMQFHVWRDEWLDQDEWATVRGTMARLVKEGKVRYWGLSANDHQPASCLRAVAEPEFHSVQVIYNLFDQSPESELFANAEEHNVAIIARCPYDEGALTGAITVDSRFPPGDFRARYFAGSRLAELQPRVERLREFLGDHAQTLPELALKFCLHHDAVTSVIPGTRKKHHLEGNLLWAESPQLPHSILAALADQAWDKNWYQPL